MTPLPHDDTTAPSQRWRRWLLLALVLLLVLALAGLAWALVERSGADDETTRSDRSEVLSATRDYARTAWNFSDEDLDAQKSLSGVADRAEPVITTAFTSTYEGLLKELAPVIAGKQVSEFRTEVSTAGVESIDEDTATVIADVDATRVSPKGKNQSARAVWVLTLKRIDGEWRVDEHDDLSAGQQQTLPGGGR